MKKGSKREKSGLRSRLLGITLVPILLLGCIITIFSYIEFNKTMETEVLQNLHNVAMATLYAYDGMYPGDYKVGQTGDGEFRLKKGYIDITDEVEYIDNLKADTGVDITLFYLDVRVLTTIRDKYGNRIVGTAANKMVVDDVFHAETSRFYNNMNINGEEYFAYYAPILNNDGECIGMIFAGKPSKDVRTEVMESALPIIGIAVIAMFIMIAVCTRLARELAEVISKEKNFLGAIAQGNLRAELDMRILNRRDELGEMGQFTVHVQKFIRDMIERDTLTKLYTRRIGELKIQVAQQNAIENNAPFCLAMGDIDFFKKFNDNYGHDCGDLVLRETAAVFNRTLFGKGFAVRWGGEEFIIIFEDMDIETAYKSLAELREAVISNKLNYGDEELNITMTFGIIEGDDRAINDIVKQADELLYYGKTHGRNQIVRFDEVDLSELESAE